MMKKYTMFFLIIMLALTMAAAASAEPGPGYGGEFFDNPEWPDQGPENIYIPTEDGLPIRIHSDYQNNTDACASCHATHTAIGSSLLQWTDVNTACMACHDGTVTITYDVMSGKIAETDERTSGGLFDGLGDSASSHAVRSGMNIGAAPGGAGSGADGNAWGDEFNCSSCHTPHGIGGNARILHPNPNRVNSEKTVTVDRNNAPQIGEEAPKWFEANLDGKYYYLLPDYALRGYGYNFLIADASTGEAIPMADYTLKVEPVTQNTVVIWEGVDEEEEYNAPARLTLTYTPSVRVTMDIDGWMTADETVEYVSGINDFCGACHTDYNAASGSHKEKVGTYSQAYRHPVGQLSAFNWEIPEGTGLKFETAGGRQIACLTCHVAHGTDEDYWGDTLGGLDYFAEAVANESLFEFSGELFSSSLKRLPNMSACEACHQMGPANYGYESIALAFNERNKANFDRDELFGAEFVGASRCGDCHTQTYNDQKNHLHTLKSRPAGDVPEWQPGGEWREAFPEDGIPLNKDTSFMLQAEDVEVVFGSKWKIRFGIRASEAWELGARWTVADPENPTDEELEGIIFGDYQYNTGIRGFEWTEHGIPDSGNYTSGSTWERNCIGCHTTGFDLAAFEANPTVMPIDPDTGDRNYIADWGVTCEACHGPGELHAADPARDNIVNPARLTVLQQNDACGACHARGFGLKDGSGRNDPIPVAMLPGDRLTNYVDIHTERLHPNSGIGTHHRMQWQELLGLSNMAHGEAGSPERDAQRAYVADVTNYSTKSKVVSCNTCHDSHGVAGYGQNSQTRPMSQLKMDYEQTCAACHGTAPNIEQAMPYAVRSAVQYDIRTHIFDRDRLIDGIDNIDFNIYPTEPK